MSSSDWLNPPSIPPPRADRRGAPPDALTEHEASKHLDQLTGMIWSHLQQHPIGRMFTAPFDVVFSDFDVVEPDLLYLSTERGASVLTPSHCEGLPISSWKSVQKVRGGGTRRSNAGFTNDSACPNTGSSIRSSTRSRCTAESASATSELPNCPENGDVLTTPLLPGCDMSLPKLFEE
jgi:hypothetical protein